MLNNSLFICYSTPNYSKLTDMCLNSLRDINVSNINHKLDIPSSSMVDTNTGIGSDLWYYCLRNKMVHLRDVLTNYQEYSDMKYFIFSDCDIHYIQKNVDEWSNLEEYISNGDKDVYFMAERNPSRDVNTGFFIIKNTNYINHLVSFFDEVLETFDATDRNELGLGDQLIINNLKHKINWGHIPDEYIIAGPCSFNRDKCLLHHATSARNVEEKIHQINYVLYQLKN